MDKEINIIIFENQKSQFITIAENLIKKSAGKMKIYPPYDEFQKEEEKCEYVEFIDHVRIVLNKRYKDERRDIAKSYLIQYIIDNNADILIIDQKLVGWHKSEDGIDLALTLRGAEIKIPILFLSRTPLNTELDKKLAGYIDLKQKYNKVSGPKIWVEKGYAGGALLDYFYFERNVFNKINELVNSYKSEKDSASCVNSLIEILDRYDDDYDTDNHARLKEFKQRINGGEILVNKELHELIHSLSNYKNLKELMQEVDNFLMKYEYDAII